VSYRPTAEEQLTFLTKVQRLFAEGEFTATYKFALLIALMELAVEQEVPASGELDLNTRSIAEKFIELYWKQSFDYSAGRLGSTGGVLSQNIGEQAAVINAVRNFRDATGRTGLTLAAARRSPAFKVLVSRVAAVVSAQPLNYLQNFGGVTDEFLFIRLRPGCIRLRLGVAYCLQRFQPLIQQLARMHWVEHIKRNRRNAHLIGDAADLEDFLFTTSRTALIAFGRELRKVSGPACFYCGAECTEDIEVDHFIPFSTYPRDLGHNFVLAHAKCNRSKSDALAAYDHLARWLDRNERQADVISEVSEECGMSHDLNGSRAIAHWGYRTGHEANGFAWLSGSAYDAISPRYLSLFG
jgi:5-methylcytosine-specific restriction endonuclease McrA